MSGPMARCCRAVFFFLLAACATAPKPPLGRLYLEYQNAIAARDAAAAERYLSAGRLRNLRAMSPDEALAAMDVISPKSELTIFSETVTGDEATLVVRANIAGNVSTGHVRFVREQGAWKIFSEMWDIGATPESAPPPARHNDAIRRLMERGYASPSADYLVMAAGTGDLEAVNDIVQFLIAAGADVNAVDDVNCTALMRAADHCNATEIVRALLAAGARTDVRAAGGATALDLATYSNCDENATLIRRAGVPPAA